MADSLETAESMLLNYQVKCYSLYRIQIPRSQHLLNMLEQDYDIFIAQQYPKAVNDKYHLHKSYSYQGNRCQQQAELTNILLNFAQQNHPVQIYRLQKFFQLPCLQERQFQVQHHSFQYSTRYRSWNNSEIQAQAEKSIIQMLIKVIELITKYYNILSNLNKIIIMKKQRQLNNIMQQQSNRTKYTEQICSKLVLLSISMSQPSQKVIGQLLTVMQQRNDTINALQQQITKLKCQTITLNKTITNLQDTIAKLQPNSNNTASNFMLASQFQQTFGNFMKQQVTMTLGPLFSSSKIYGAAFKKIVQNHYKYVKDRINQYIQQICKLLKIQATEHERVFLSLLRILQDNCQTLIPLQGKKIKKIGINCQVYTQQIQQIEASQEYMEMQQILHKLCIYMLLQQKKWQFEFCDEPLILFSKKQGHQCLDGFVKDSQQVYCILQGIKRQTHLHQNLKYFVVPYQPQDASFQFINLQNLQKQKLSSENSNKSQERIKQQNFQIDDQKIIIEDKPLIPLSEISNSRAQKQKIPNTSIFKDKDNNNNKQQAVLQNKQKLIDGTHHLISNRFNQENINIFLKGQIHKYEKANNKFIDQQYFNQIKQQKSFLNNSNSGFNSEYPSPLTTINLYKFRKTQQPCIKSQVLSKNNTQKQNNLNQINSVQCLQSELQKIKKQKIRSSPKLIKTSSYLEISCTQKENIIANRHYQNISKSIGKKNQLKIKEDKKIKREKSGYYSKQKIDCSDGSKTYNNRSKVTSQIGFEPNYDDIVVLPMKKIDQKINKSHKRSRKNSVGKIVNQMQSKQTTYLKSSKMKEKMYKQIIKDKLMEQPILKIKTDRQRKQQNRPLRITNINKLRQKYLL